MQKLQHSSDVKSITITVRKSYLVDRISACRRNINATQHFIKRFQKLRAKLKNLQQTKVTVKHKEVK